MEERAEFCMEQQLLSVKLEKKERELQDSSRGMESNIMGDRLLNLNSIYTRRVVQKEHVENPITVKWLQKEHVANSTDVK